MHLFDPFADSTRDPGVRRGAELFILGENPFTQAQRALVENAYALFRLQNAAALPGLRVHDVVLADGSTVHIESNNGHDIVYVTPAAGQRILYELLPAMWLNAPANGDPLPDPVNSATWSGMPLDVAQPPTLRENFWRQHPGNMTWRDARADAPTKGLVLSWWCLGKTRYGAHIFSPGGMAKTTESDNYDDLYCNGVKIGEFSQNVWSACIGEVDGELTIIVLTATGTITTAGGGSWYAESYGSATADPDFNCGVSQRSSLTFKLWHARLPASFKGYQFGMLEFTTIRTVALHSATVNVGGTNRSMGTFWMLGPNPPKFNASGTKGILHIECLVDTTHLLPYVYIDPATGDLYIDDSPSSSGFHQPWWWAAMRTAVRADAGATIEEPFCELNRVGNVVAYDFEGDDIVVAAVPFITVAGTTKQYHYTSKHGIHYADNVSLSGAYDYSICGDLREDYVTFVQRKNTGSGIFTSPGETNIWSYLGGTTPTWTSTSTPPVYSYLRMSIGFEGCDSSFDGRLIVDRCDGDVRVFADAADVSADLADPDFQLQDVQYPVLCGPLARLDGTPAPARQYVAGDPP